MSRLPEGWNFKTIKELDLDISDGNYSSKYPKQSDFMQEGIPFIRANNIKNMTVIKEDMRYISQQQHAELKKGHLKQNDILITTRGDIGQVAIVPNKFIGANINAQIVRIGVSKSIYYKYLAYVLTDHNIQKDINALETGTALKQLPVKKFYLLKIPLPPLEEQKEIAEILSTVDEKIAFVDKSIEETQTLKKGLMQKLLTEGIGHTEFKESELGRIPVEWEVMELGALGKVSMCKRVLKSQTTETGEIPFYKIGTFGKKADSYIDKELYEEFKRKYSYPKKGDILISASGTIGRTVIFNGEAAYFQDSNIVWIANKEEKVLNIFLYYIYSVIKWTTEDTTISRLYNDNLRNMKIIAPPLEEQKQIAQILSTTDEKLEILREKKKFYERLKKGLMQKLLTGEVRV